LQNKKNYEENNPNHHSTTRLAHSGSNFAGNFRGAGNLSFSGFQCRILFIGQAGNLRQLSYYGAAICNMESQLAPRKCYLQRLPRAPRQRNKEVFV